MTRLMDSLDGGPVVSHYPFSTRIPSLAQGSMGHELMVILTLQEVRSLLFGHSLHLDSLSLLAAKELENVVSVYQDKL